MGESHRQWLMARYRSPALAQADVSIAQGGGSQAAASTADFALISESLLSIITLQAIARSTYRRIISNFCWACIYNIVLIPLAAGAFYDLGRTKLPAVCKRRSAHLILLSPGDVDSFALQGRHSRWHCRASAS